MVVHDSAHVEQPAEHRVADGRGQWAPGRVHRRSAREAGGRMQRDRTRCRGVQMALHFGDQKVTGARVDAQGLADAR